jgi:3-deoxy-D-manno-octulosonic-acid transferase
MGLLYRLFPTVFIGKSLVPGGGGQNPLEAARLGCSLAAGPFMANQAEAAAVLTACGALVTVADQDGLAAWVDTMLRDPAARETAGQAAMAAASTNADLPERAASLLIAMAG